MNIWEDTLGCECLLEITQPLLRDSSKLIVRLWLLNTCRRGENIGLKNGQQFEIQDGYWGLMKALLCNHIASPKVQSTTGTGQ